MSIFLDRLQLRCYIPEEDLIPLASTMCEEKFDTVHSDVDGMCCHLIIH